MAGGGLFLIKGLSNYVGKVKTRRYLLDTAVSLYKGDFNTPSALLFFKKENGGKICLNYFVVLNCNVDTIAEAATAQIWLISTATHIPFSPNPKNERR